MDVVEVGVDLQVEDVTEVGSDRNILELERMIHH